MGSGAGGQDRPPRDRVLGEEEGPGDSPRLAGVGGAPGEPGRRQRGAKSLGSSGRGHPGGGDWQEEGGFNWKRGRVLRVVVGSLEVGAPLRKHGGEGWCCRKG